MRETGLEVWSAVYASRLEIGTVPWQFLFRLAGIVPIDMAIGSETNEYLSEKKHWVSPPLVYKSQSSPKSFKIL